MSSQKLSTGPGRPALDDAAVAHLRDQIVDAAGRVFDRQGAGATTIDDIAKEAGLSRAGVYRYAGGRDDLILAVTLRRFDEWVTDVVHHVEKFDTAAAVITEAIVWTARTVEKDPSLRALFSGGTAVAASRVLTKRKTGAPTNPWRQQFGATLRTHEHELRAGLDPDLVADRVLTVLLDELARDHDGTAAARRDRVTTWLLPAVLEDRPPLPDAVARPDTTPTTTEPAEPAEKAPTVRDRKPSPTPARRRTPRDPRKDSTP